MLYYKNNEWEMMELKQEEKSRKSREHILAHAFEEFGTRGYAGSSINAICANGHISKGILYHHFADKDALYLACVEICFSSLTEFLSTQLASGELNAERYFGARLTFAREHPLYQELLCDVVMYPQPHLAPQLLRCRAPFDTLNRSFLVTVLEKEHLVEGMSLEEAVEQFRFFVDFLGVRLRNTDGPVPYEQQCRQLLHTMLYGMIAR